MSWKHDGLVCNLICAGRAMKSQKQEEEYVLVM